MADLPEGFVLDKLPDDFVVDQPTQALGAPQIAADVAKSVGIGLAKGPISATGMPGDIAAALWPEQPPVDVSESYAGKVPARPLRPPTSAELQRQVEQYTGPFYKPQTAPGKFAETTGEFLGNPLSYIGPGSIGAKAMTATTGALGSEALGQMLEGTSAEPYGRLFGAILGGLSPRASARAATPLPLSPERQATVQTLRQEGIEPTAGQVTGNRALRYAEGELGESPGAGGSATREYGRVGDEFTRAALTRIGVKAERATPAVVDQAATRIGNQFDALSARNRAPMDPQYFNDLFAAQKDYDHLFVDPLKKPLVENIITHATNQAARNPTLDGAQYKALRSRIERMRRSNQSDPELSMFLADVRNAMDDLMERSIRVNNPRDLGAWQEARNQYRNLLVIQAANTGAGEAAAAGIISPAKLRQAVVGQNRKAYSRGRGDYAELARAGEEIMSPLPQSGTAPRAFIRAVPAALAAGLGALHGTPEAMLGAIAGTAAPGVAGRALLSRPVQAYLKNQAFADVLRRMEPKRSVMLRSALPVSPFLAPSTSPFTPD